MSRHTPKGSTGVLRPACNLRPLRRSIHPLMTDLSHSKDPGCLNSVAAFICLTTLLTYVNFRFIGLPPTIGVMVTALLFSLILQGLSVLGYPGLEERIQQLIGQIDFGDLLMNWMLSFLLFAGALHVNLNDLRSYRWPIGLLATFGVLIATVVIGSLAYWTFRPVRLARELPRLPAVRRI